MVVLVASIYADQQASEVLWAENQAVTLDQAGRYTIAVGASLEDGIPAEVFVSGAARWLAIAVQGEAEQPRVMLVTVPYALKAREAETLAGRVAADFVLSENLSSAVKTALEETGPKGGGGGTTSGLTANSLAKFTDAGGTLGDSNAFDVGGNIGIGTTSPSSIWTPTLQIRGAFGGLALTSNAVGGGTFSIGSNVEGAARKLSIFDETAAAYRFTINHTGSVGIGTTFPSSVWTPTLHVAGTFGGLALTSTAPSGGTFSIGSNSEGGARKLSIFDETAGAYRMTINSTGNGGIGTATPTSVWTPTLHVAGTFGGLALTSTAVNGGTFSIGSNSEGGIRKLSFFDETAGAYRLTINNIGNVGIGTTTPASLLDIAGALTQRGTAAPALAPGGQGRIFYDSGLNRFRVSQNGGAYADLVGGGFALPFAQTASSASPGSLFDLTQTGTGGVASFTTSNVLNGSPAVRIERNGVGDALVARNIGTSGGAAVIQIDNSNNPSTALTVSVNGTGNGASITAGSGGIGLIVGGMKALDINGRFRMTGAPVASGATIDVNYGFSIVEVICTANNGTTCTADATPAQITLPSGAELGSIIWITTIDAEGVVVNNLRGGGIVNVSQNVIRGFIFYGGSGNIFPAPSWRPFF